ncbi:MAG: hypothetical protein QM820_04510 [Minicystis sp.]
MAVAVGVAACGGGTTVPPHDAGPDASGGSGGTGGSGGNPNGDCPGQCVPGNPVSWSFPPNLVWFGPEEDVPDCPPGVALAFQGHADLDAPLDCGTCTCAPPTGSCTLPATMTANAATCALNGASTPHTPFDPASGWIGACDSNESIPAGKLCSGVKCVQSITIPPLTLSEGTCSPSQPPTPSPPTWKTFVRGCQAQPKFACPSTGDVCLVSPPPGSGFRTCIYKDGDIECPSDFSKYTEKHVVYQHFTDTRACAPCSCGSPSGSSCSASISVFTDGACSSLALSATVSSAQAVCHDLPAGTPLGSKSATPPAYTPGTCAASGGEPMGEATPIQPATYCCLPAP